MVSQAVSQLTALWLNNPALRNAITRASNDIDRVLGMGPPNQGVPDPRPGYPGRRVVSINLISVGFHYDPNGVEVVVTSIELNPPPPYVLP